MKKLIICLIFLLTQKGYCQWEILSSGYHDVSLKDITQTPSGRLVAVGTGFFGINFTPHIFTSDNNGMTWDTIQVAPAGFFFETIGFLDHDLGYIGGFGAYTEVLLTGDGGSTWDYYYEDQANSGINDIEVVDSVHVLAGGYGPDQFMSGSVYSLTAQLYWDPIAQSFPSSSIDDLQMINTDTGYALSYSENKIYKTTNGGTTWDSLNSFPVHCGKMFWWDMNNGVVVGTGAHYYLTNNGGSSWDPYVINGYSNELTGVAFFDRDHGYACSLGGKLFQSTDGGMSWINIPSLVTSDLYNLEIHGGNAYAVGANGTILRSAAPTAVNEIKNADHFQVFPNPASDFFYVTTDLIKTGQLISAELTGVDGKKIIGSGLTGNNDHIRFDISSTTKGIYFLRLTTQQGIYMKKVVVL